MKIPDCIRAVALWPLVRLRRPDLPKKLPEAGEEWRISDGDPFPPLVVSVVIEARDGWVRYRIGRDSRWSIWSDERMPLDRFVKCYRFHSLPNTKTTDAEARL